MPSIPFWIISFWVLLAKLGFLFVLALCAFVVATQYMDLEAAPEASLSIQDEELVARSLAQG